MTAGKVTMHINPLDQNRFDEEVKDYAERVVQILDAHNEAVDRIKRQKCFAVAVGVFGVLSVLVSMALA